MHWKPEMLACADRRCSCPRLPAPACACTHTLTPRPYCTQVKTLEPFVWVQQPVAFSSWQLESRATAGPAVAEDDVHTHTQDDVQ